MKKIIRIVLPVSPAELSTAAQRILRWFFAYPNKDFTFNELCKATGTSKTNAKVVVEELIRRGFIAKTVLGRLWRLVAHPQSEKFRQMKIAATFENVYASGIVELVRKKYPQARAIILFGSFRKGDDIVGSDIDIAVEVSGKQELVIESLGVIHWFGYRRDVMINIHIFSRQNVDINLFSNIANGIVLDGFLEVRP